MPVGRPLHRRVEPREHRDEGTVDRSLDLVVCHDRGGERRAAIARPGIEQPVQLSVESSASGCGGWSAKV